MKKNSSIKISTILFIIVLLLHFANNLSAKAITDKQTGAIYYSGSEKKDDPNFYEFIVTRGERIPVFESLETMNVIKFIPNKTFLQLLETKKKYSFVKIPDMEEGYVEGWIKNTKIRKTKKRKPKIYYGANLQLLEDLIEQDPAWTKVDFAKIKEMPKESSNDLAEVYFGQQVYVQEEVEGYSKIKIYDEYEQEYFDGWIASTTLTRDEKVIDETLQEDKIEEIAKSDIDNERIKALKERLKALDQKKKKKLLELEKAADEEITFYSGKLNKKKYKLIETTNRIQELKQILSTEKEKLAGYKENIKINNRAIEKEDKIISELNEKLLLSLSESERKKKKQEFIESDTKKYRKEITKQEAYLTDINSDITKEKRELLALNEQIENFLNQINSKKNKITTLNQEWEKNKQEQKKQKELLAEKTEQEKLEAIKKITQDKIKELQANLHNKKLEMDDILKSISLNDKNLISFSDKLQTQQKELESNKKKIGELKDAISEIKISKDEYLVDIKKSKQDKLNKILTIEKQIANFQQKLNVNSKEQTKTQNELSDILKKLKLDNQNLKLAKSEQNKLIDKLNNFKNQQQELLFAKIEKEKQQKLLDDIKDQKLTEAITNLNTLHLKETELNKQIIQKKSELSSLKIRNERNQNTRTELTEELTSNQLAITKLQNENKLLIAKKTEKTAALKKKITELKKALKIKEINLNKINKDHNLIDKDIAKLETELKNKYLQKDKLEKNVLHLKKEKIQLLEDSKRLAQEQELIKQRKIKTLTKQLQEQKNRLIAINSDISELNNRINTKTSDITNLNSKRITLNKEMTTLLNTVKKVKQNKADYTSKIEKEKEKKKKLIVQRKLKIEQLYDNLDEANKKLSTIDLTLNITKSTLNSYQTDNNILKTKIKSKNQSISRLKKRIVKLNLRKNESKKTAKLLVAKNSKELQKLRKELISVKQKLSTNKTAKIKLHAKLKSDETKLSKLTDNKIKLNSKITGLKKKNQLAQNSLKEKKKLYKQLKKNLKTLKKKRNRIKSSLIASTSKKEILLENIESSKIAISEKKEEIALKRKKLNLLKAKKIEYDSDQEKIKLELAELEEAKRNLSKKKTKSSGKRKFKKSKKRIKRFKRKNKQQNTVAASDKDNKWNRSSSKVNFMITKKRPTVVNLYKRAKAKDKLLKGQVTVKFSLTTAGKTKKVRIVKSNWSNKIQGQKLNKAIEKKIRSWKFPADNHPDDKKRKTKALKVAYIFS